MQDKDKLKKKLLRSKYELIKKAVNELGALKVKIYGDSMLPNFKSGQEIWICAINNSEEKIFESTVEQYTLKLIIKDFIMQKILVEVNASENCRG